MAHRGICPDMACERVAIEVKNQRNEHKACQVVAEELGLPLETIRTWLKRSKVGSNEPKITVIPTVSACAVSDLQAVSDLDIKFRTVYADPPWQYSNQATRSCTDNHYGTMTLDDICALPIATLVDANAHLHIWTTNGFLFEARRVMESWGFTYKSCFVWVKPQMGIGNYWRVSHEFMLLGVRGSCSFRDKGQMSWQAIDRTKHSAKPHAVRKMIEKVSYPPYLELFARQAIPGWVCWGNEIERNLFNAHLLAQSV